MIRGAVNTRREAVVTLRLRGPTGAETDAVIVIDTGFSDELTLPINTVAYLSLTFREDVDFILADGTIRTFGTYDAEVMWDGSWRQLVVTCTGKLPLLGTRLLKGHQLSVTFEAGGTVELSRLP